MLTLWYYLARWLYSFRGFQCGLEMALDERIMKRRLTPAERKSFQFWAV